MVSLRPPLFWAQGLGFEGVGAVTVVCAAGLVLAIRV